MTIFDKTYNLINYYKRFGIYSLVQFISYGLDFFSFFLIFYLIGIDPIISNVIVKLIVSIFAYFMHKKYTYRGDSNNKSMMLFAFSVFLYIPISTAFLSLVILILPQAFIAKLTSDAILFLLSYKYNSYFVFRKK